MEIQEGRGYAKADATECLEDEFVLGVLGGWSAIAQNLRKVTRGEDAVNPPRRQRSNGRIDVKFKIHPTAAPIIIHIAQIINSLSEFFRAPKFSFFVLWLRLRVRSSVGEHYVDIVGVAGSIPAAPTIPPTLSHDRSTSVRWVDRTGVSVGCISPTP